MRRSLLTLLLLTLCAPAFLSQGTAFAGATTTLSVTIRGAGGGSVTGSTSSIVCPPTCSEAGIAQGSTITLSAVPDAHSVFTGWSGAGCSGTGTCDVLMDADHTVRATFAPAVRPDGWIKLCGLSTGCVVGPPPPHPWRGNDVYNGTGKRQTVAVRMEDGEGVRFFITFQNDGAVGDTFTLRGCKGTPRFVINAVLIGKHTRPGWGPTVITRQFKAGTKTFTFPPASAGKKVVITLNIVAPTTAEGITYACPVTIRSNTDPTVRDTVVGKMTTY